MEDATSIKDFVIGPDKAGDIRQQRPYFSVQLEQDGEPVVSEFVLERIQEYLHTSNSKTNPITDIYFLSHGWHRNYFVATSAYDRLVSRFVRLRGRGVLTTERPFRPLILGAHWHSDPGEDQWSDPAGRRDKTSFLQNIEIMFERPSSIDETEVLPQDRFTTVFEQCFAFFSRMSASDTYPLTDANMTATSACLAGQIDKFSLRDFPSGPTQDKVIAAWTCYHESTPKQALADQEIGPNRGMTFWQGCKNLGRFFLGALGIGAAFGIFLKIGPVADTLKVFEAKFITVQQLFYSRLSGTFPSKPILLHTGLADLWYGACWSFVGIIVLLAASGIGFIYLACLGALKDKPKRVAPFWTIAAWVPCQILLSLPVLVLAFFTYFVSQRQRLVHGGVFAERIGNRNEAIASTAFTPAMNTMGFPERTSKSATARQWAARLAITPIQLFKKTLDDKNPAQGMFSSLENTLAFYENQIRGTVAGATSAKFLHTLLVRLKSKGFCTEDVKVHLIGHSFGGLVVLNAARHLALDPNCGGQSATSPEVSIHSISLLQAAVASNWIEGEAHMLANIKGAFGCVYSAYDTANSFYYPIANGGRLAAGYVGLCGLPDTSGLGAKPAYRIPRLADNNYNRFDTEPKDFGLFSLLVSPPNLADRLPPKPDREILNLDASRIVFEGPVLTGGGHTDIYKDDIINLVWSVSQIQ